MSKVETGRYDRKYGDRVKSRNGKMNGNGQYDVKDIDSGDHHFVNTQTGVQGTALGSYRPFRNSSGSNSNSNSK